MKQGHLSALFLSSEPGGEKQSEVSLCILEDRKFPQSRAESWNNPLLKSQTFRELEDGGKGSGELLTALHFPPCMGQSPSQG